MTRVATVPMQRNLFDAISRSQEKLALTQVQLGTGRKAQDFSDLGTQTVRNLAAHSLLARHESHATVSSRVGTTLSLYDSNISAMETVADDLRVDLLNAIGTGDAAGIEAAAKAAFDQIYRALNAAEGGVALFAGANSIEEPFKPSSLADLVGLDPADAFANDDVRASARVSEDIDLSYGITASELGTGLVSAFRTIAEIGALGTKLTDAQADAMKTAVAQLDESLVTIRGINAENGRRQAQVETLNDRAEQRTLLLKKIIAENEDADLAEVAGELTQRKTMLEASYSVFSKLSSLSLIQYI